MGHPEVVAALAITANLADYTNHMLQPALSRPTWSDDMVADYFDEHKDKARARNGMQNLRYAEGWCRRNYGPLQLTRSDLALSFGRTGQSIT
jgi:hypothetical protein